MTQCLRLNRLSCYQKKLSKRVGGLRSAPPTGVASVSLLLVPRPGKEVLPPSVSSRSCEVLSCSSTFTGLSKSPGLSHLGGSPPTKTIRTFLAPVPVSLRPRVDSLVLTPYFNPPVSVTSLFTLNLGGLHKTE